LYKYTAIAPRDLAYFGGDQTLLDLHAAMRKADEAWQGAAAFDLGYDVVRELCTDYIAASYKFQKARWGRIRTRMSASALMR